LKNKQNVSLDSKSIPSSSKNCVNDHKNKERNFNYEIDENGTNRNDNSTKSKESSNNRSERDIKDTKLMHGRFKELNIVCGSYLESDDDVDKLEGLLSIVCTSARI
jgi:hypothetical protein